MKNHTHWFALEHSLPTSITLAKRHCEIKKKLSLIYHWKAYATRFVVAYLPHPTKVNVKDFMYHTIHGQG